MEKDICSMPFVDMMVVVLQSRMWETVWGTRTRSPARLTGEKDLREKFRKQLAGVGRGYICLGPGNDMN